MVPKTRASSRTASPLATSASSGGSGRGGGEPVHASPIRVGYSVDPISQGYHFGYGGGADSITQFRFTTVLAAYKPGLRELREKLIRYSPATARKIITDAPFEAKNREALEKPGFLFGDAIEHSDKILFKEEGKWLYQAGDLLMFLPNMERSYPLVYLQRLSSHRKLEFELTREYDGAATGKFGANGAFCQNRA